MADTAKYSSRTTSALLSPLTTTSWSHFSPIKSNSICIFLRRILDMQVPRDRPSRALHIYTRQDRQIDSCLLALRNCNRQPANLFVLAPITSPKAMHARIRNQNRKRGRPIEISHTLVIPFPIFFLSILGDKDGTRSVEDLGNTKPYQPHARSNGRRRRRRRRVLLCDRVCARPRSP